MIRSLNHIPEQKLDNGPEKGKVLVLGWGSTYGAIKSAVADLLSRRTIRFRMRISVMFVLFQKILEILIKNFEQVLIPELNNGQLIKIIRDQYLVDAKGYNKIMGIPFTKHELMDEIKKCCKSIVSESIREPHFILSLPSVNPSFKLKVK